ncbi:Adhesion regulating molecule conserved region family protein [Aphelenchoides avenae]|nr:Adhesion regulating molecule conserved region family protein [Aphelenchus avenae]
MFANTRGNQGPTSGYLLEFKAGKSDIEPGTGGNMRKVVAKKDKGLCYIKQSNDQLMHFCWKNRETNHTEEDLIVFPGDTEFVKIKECTTGRVYMLKFKSSGGAGGTPKLFWMQDSKEDKDDEICKKVNDILNNPPTARASARGGSTERGQALSSFAALNSALGGNSDEVSALGNMDHNQLMQLFNLMNGGAGGADGALPLTLNSNRSDSPAPETPTTTRPKATGAGGVKFDPATLSEIINNLPSASSGQRRKPVDLSAALSRANIKDAVVANADRLTSLLPDQPPVKQDREELEATVSAPQFQQAVDFFGAAFQTGQLAPALQHFNLPESVVQAATQGDMVEFAKKLTEAENGGPSATKRDAKEIDAQIKAEADAEETTESTVQEPKAKRGKTDDNMDLD